MIVLWVSSTADQGDVPSSLLNVVSPPAASNVLRVLGYASLSFAKSQVANLILGQCGCPAGLAATLAVGPAAVAVQTTAKLDHGALEVQDCASHPKQSAQSSNQQIGQ